MKSHEDRVEVMTALAKTLMSHGSEPTTVQQDLTHFNAKWMTTFSKIGKLGYFLWSEFISTVNL